MGVLVCYDDFTYDVVNDYHLDYLVATGCIVGYDKSGEWVKTEKWSGFPHNLTKSSATARQVSETTKKAEIS
ncbi:MAG: hypothetical protein A2075_03695 [Geobacteraceae bacterium GWC2_58_44]|nr:MAG: hypothetical protein A2075_03695 [Geobacteraceae bacterium GWC2_58_44]HBG06273.1 hypothetical protein [Geobacter sp.]